jgi:hypothetical protein
MLAFIFCLICSFAGLVVAIGSLYGIFAFLMCEGILATVAVVCVLIPCLTYFFGPLWVLPPAGIFFIWYVCNYQRLGRLKD